MAAYDRTTGSLSHCRTHYKEVPETKSSDEQPTTDSRMDEILVMFEMYLLLSYVAYVA